VPHTGSAPASSLEPSGSSHPSGSAGSSTSRKPAGTLSAGPWQGLAPPTCHRVTRSLPWSVRFARMGSRKTQAGVQFKNPMRADRWTMRKASSRL
jgi:hypothetical protein